MRQKRKARARAAREKPEERDKEVTEEEEEEQQQQQQEAAAEVATASEHDADSPPEEATLPGGEDEGGSEDEAFEGELDASEAARDQRLTSILESLLFAADKPLSARRLGTLAHHRDAKLMTRLLGELAEQYRDRGIVLHEVAGGWQLRTAPQNSRYVQALVGGRPVRLTRAQLETLAIIAYRQPITRPEIDDIRGVDSGGTLKVLLDRHLIRVLGKKEEPGRPLLYGTTRDFLEFFNLSDLRELPTLREYHELTEDSMRVVERMGVELEELAEAAAAAEPEAESEAETETETETESETESESDAASPEAS